MSQKSCNILVVYEAKFCMLLLSLWRWTTLDYEMLTLPDTLQVLFTGFASMASNMDLKTMVLGLPKLSWLLKFLQPE